MPRGRNFSRTGFRGHGSFGFPSAGGGRRGRGTFYPFFSNFSRRPRRLWTTPYISNYSVMQPYNPGQWYYPAGYAP